MAADQSGGSFHSFLQAMKSGDDDAAQTLWETFVTPLLAVARKKLRAMRVPDASACVQEAIWSIIKGLRRNAFPNLNDHGDLWGLLVVVTARKASHQIRDELREKRGGGRIVNEAALIADGEQRFNGLERFFGTEPTPEFQALWAEEFERRLTVLNPDYQEVALLRMDGHSNAEIAELLDVAVRTVERRLAYIRRVWSQTGLDEVTE